MISCYDVHGNIVLVPVDALQFNPAAYGILIDEYNQVFLLRHAETRLWYPPGGQMAVHETPLQMVRAAFRRATGITPQVDRLVYTEERFEVDEAGRPFHIVALYYRLSKPDIISASMGETAATTLEGRWIPLNELSRPLMQFGFTAITAVASPISAA